MFFFFISILRTYRTCCGYTVSSVAARLQNSLNTVKHWLCTLHILPSCFALAMDCAAIDILSGQVADVIFAQTMRLPVNLYNFISTSSSPLRSRHYFVSLFRSTFLSFRRFFFSFFFLLLSKSTFWTHVYGMWWAKIAWICAHNHHTHTQAHTHEIWQGYPAQAWPQVKCQDRARRKVEKKSSVCSPAVGFFSLFLSIFFFQIISSLHDYMPQTNKMNWQFHSYLRHIQEQTTMLLQLVAPGSIKHSPFGGENEGCRWVQRLSLWAGHDGIFY